MLNNPTSWDLNWGVKYEVIKPPVDPVDPVPLLVVGNLISWLENKNPEEHYTYTNNKGCVLYQYLSESGVDVDYIDANRYSLISIPETTFPYPSILNSIAYGSAESHFENMNTFGAALMRARRARDSQSYAA